MSLTTEQILELQQASDVEALGAWPSALDQGTRLTAIGACRCGVLATSGGCRCTAS